MSPITQQGPLETVPQSPSSGGVSGGLDLQSITDRVAPAVVDVNTALDAVGGGQPSGRAAGTGMVLTSSGEVLTNNHVVAGATSIAISIAGRSGDYTATVIGVDIADDVALLQIRGGSGLSTVTLADSSGLAVGQRVVALGNAYGRGGAPSSSEGTISALGRDITVSNDRGGTEELKNVIQTDARIAPGDSGGPLVNGNGQVVGMITAGARSRRSVVGSNVGFAIPVNTAVGVVNEIRAGHSTENIIIGPVGFLGVRVQGVSAGSTQGAPVVDVIPGTPAEQAGITVNSVITAIDGHQIDSADALGPVMHSYKPGQQIRVSWRDQSGAHSSSVTLIKGPAV